MQDHVDGASDALIAEYFDILERGFGFAVRGVQFYCIALSYYNYALKLRPNYYFAYVLKIGLYLNQKSFDSVRNLVPIVLHNCQQTLTPSMKLVFEIRNLELEQKFEQAVEQYKKAIELDPLNNFAYYNCGHLLDRMKRFDESLVMFEKALELSTFTNCFALNAIGWVSCHMYW